MNQGKHKSKALSECKVEVANPPSIHCLDLDILDSFKAEMLHDNKLQERPLSKRLDYADQL